MQVAITVICLQELVPAPQYQRLRMGRSHGGPVPCTWGGIRKAVTGVWVKRKWEEGVVEVSCSDSLIL